MDKESIKRAIITKVGSRAVAYPFHTIGITHEPSVRKQRHEADGKSTGNWRQWQASSLADAREIEADFISRGMQGGTGGDLSYGRPVYVYIF